MSETEKILLSIEIQGTQQQVSELAKINAEINQIRKNLKENKNLSASEAEQEKINLKNKSDAYRKLQTEIKNQNKVQQESVMTLDKMRAALAKMTSEYSKIPVGTKQFADQQAKMKSLRDDIFKAEAATGNFTRNVGNYAGDVTKAFGAMGIPIGNLQRIISNVSKAQTVLQGATLKSAGALKIFKIALVSTGVGAIVVALGALVSYVMKSQEAINKINKVLIPLRTVFERIVGIIQDFGKGLFQILSGNFTQGIKTMQESWQGVGDAISEAYKEGERLAALNEQLKNIQLDIARNEKRITREMALRREILMDESYRDAERKKAGEQWYKLQQDLLKLKTAELKNEIETYELRQKQNVTTHEETLEYERKKAELDDIQAEAARERIRVNARMRTIREKELAIITQIEDAENKSIELLLKKVTANEKISQQMEAQRLKLEQMTFAAPEEETTEDNLPSWAQVISEAVLSEQQAIAQMNNQVIMSYKDRFAAIEQLVQQGIITEQQAADRRKMLENDVLQTKLGAAAAGLNAVVQVAGEQTRLGKAAAIASAIISTYQAANMALANPPGPPFSQIYAAAAIITGLANVSKIMETPNPNMQPKFAHGVIGVQGAGTGTSDSINARISKGESVMTAKATEKYAPALAWMEQSVGNKPNIGGYGRRRFARGVIAASSGSADFVTLQGRQMKEMFAAISEMRVVVSEKDITNTQNRIKKINVIGDI